MLKNIRNFSKTIPAKIILVIIIIPFIFWGMGGVFSGGNSNNLVKINNENISTEQFMNYINNSKIDQDIIKKNIDKNILEQIISELVSKTLINLEIKRLKIRISDELLATQIKQNINFKENNKFSRVKYEKFLLSNNLTAPNYELRLKEQEQQKILFGYISGGIKSPYFLTNNIYQNQTKKIVLNYINLKNNYKKKFSKNEIEKYINENKNDLERKYINFKYAKITPENLIGLKEFNQSFFDKIDEIENKISNNISFDEISSQFNLKKEYIKNYNNLDKTKNKNFFEKIYTIGNLKKVQLLDENNFFVLYEIDVINKIIPDINDTNFKNEITNKLSNKKMFEFNNDLIKKINTNNFSSKSFQDLTKSGDSKIGKIILESINDDAKFTNESIKIIYSLPKNNYALVLDNDKNIYIINVVNIINKNISKDSNDYLNYNTQANIKTRDNMYSSYDLLLNERYKIKINQKVLDRIKNYFR